MKKSLCLIVVILLLSLSFTSGIVANEPTFDRTIYVDDDNTEGPWDGTQEHPYQFIQDGIDASENGNIVYVYSGEYHEDVVIKKSITLQGENRENTVIDGTRMCVNVKVSHVIITGFTLRNGKLEGGIVIGNSYHVIIDGNIMIDNYNAVALYYCNHISVRNNIMNNNSFGFYIWFSPNCTISNNIIRFCTSYGIYLLYSENIYITSNNIHDNKYWGICFWHTDYCIIKDNVVSNNGLSGISHGHGSYIVTIDNNTIIYNADDGIVTNSHDAIITRNTILSNGRYGVNTNYAYGCIVSDNILKSNRIGIRVYAANDNIYYCNHIADNLEYGIKSDDYLDDESKDNHFYCNNLSNNSVSAWDSGNNFWYSKINKMGNYWSDYIGEDNNNDGIGDTPYKISGGDNDDLYPFMEPVSRCESPVFLKFMGPTSGKAGIEYTYKVTAIDLEGDQIYYKFDWGDGTQSDTDLYNSGEEGSASHTWAEQGSYANKVKAIDEYGTESDWATLEVSMPKNKIINPFERFLDNHPYMFPLLRQLLGLQ